MAPVHVLVNNLLYDFSQVAARRPFRRGGERIAPWSK